MKPGKFAAILSATILVTGMLVQARAEDKKTDPSGTYSWTVPSRNGGSDRTNTLELKLEGEKVTGKLTTPGRDGQLNTTEIKDGKLTGEDISFTITREFNGNSFTSKYAGKVADGSITGKIEFERNGETQSRDWNAKRTDEKK